jgi:serine/threonine-protein kinase
VDESRFPLLEEEDAEWESTVRQDIMVGKKIGEYVVRRRIGSGGMGVVYEGEHPDIGRKVAIKIIRPDSSEGVRSRELIAEARAASAIRHRGIIDIFGFGTLPGVGQYLVMEFLNGRPLDEVILDRAPMPPAEVIRLMTEVLGALSAAHAEGVIHRDLKPGNIFVVLESNGSEYVKVLDFGLAKKGTTPNSATPQTRASMIVGTPEYMAPEQACGQAVSPRTDLYAAGIIMFELLTGRLPFRGDSPMHVAIMQVQNAPPAPSSFVDGLPPELDALILRMLAKDPEQRPLSADLVARELKGIARMLSMDMTQLSGFARAAPDPEARSGVRQAAPGPAPQRTVTGSRQAAEPALPQTLLSPGSRPALTPAPVEQGLARGARQAAPAARPQATRPRPVEEPVEVAPRGSAPTTEVGLRRDLMPGGQRTKVALGVGLAAVLLGVGVGVVALKRGDGPSVPVVEDPVVLPDTRPKPIPRPVEPVLETGSAQATAPVPDSKNPEAASAQTVAQASTQTGTPSQVETPSRLGSDPEPAQPQGSQQKDATSGDKLRSPVTGNGRLKVVSECYAKVFVDGLPRGTVPSKVPIVLSAGTHNLELRESPAIKNPRKTISIRAGATTEYPVICPPSPE